MSEAGFRCGTIVLAGRPNTGKSSLLNRLVGTKLSIVSPKAQTTRHLVTGVLTTADCQYVFVDAPGIQLRHRGPLYRRLNRRAAEAARETDTVAFVVEANRFGAEDRVVLKGIPERTDTVLVVNKIDRIRRRDELLPFLDRVAGEREFRALVPVSAQTGRNVLELLRVLREGLPVAPALYPQDQLTDRDERFFASELIREQLYRTLGDDLPYRCAVTVERFVQEGKLRRIEATILVERASQKPIVIGGSGERLKRIATAARKGMEKLFGGKVYLGVWVKVRSGWTEDERALRQLGFG